MAHFEIDGLPFHIRIDGREGAPWVMMAHGLATNLAMWDDLVDVLKGEYQCLRYDARGHGATPPTPGDYSFELLTRDAAKILDALHVERTHFVGLSMGGMVALGLALHVPDRLASISVCDARGEADEEYIEGWNHRIQIVRKGGMAALIDRTLQRWFTPAFLAKPSPALDKMRSMMGETSPDGYCGCGEALKALHYGARLSEIRTPTMLLVGAQDLGAPPPIVREMHRAMPESRYVEIPDAGHISNVEQPVLFAAAVRGFLKEVEATRKKTETGF
jgi:3-oxoadipate enol-lactonase